MLYVPAFTHVYITVQNVYRLLGATLIGIFFMLPSYFKIKILVKCREYSTLGLKGIHLAINNAVSADRHA